MKGFTLFEVMVIIFTVTILGLLGWVFIHFISKFW